MSDERACYYRGRPYSHGAKICSNGNEQQCRDGTWIDTGNTCLSDSIGELKAEFLSADRIERSEKFEGMDIDAIDSCGGFSIIHEAADYINLLNKCDDYVQIGISWANNPSVLYYRMPPRRRNAPYIARQILIRGIRGRIVSSEKWNFRYGQDVTRDARIFETPMGNGDVLIGITNPSSLHMVFRVDIFRDGDFEGYTYGVTEKGQSQDRIEAKYAGENKRFEIRSAFLDPE